MHRIDLAERRRRLAQRHGLARPIASPREAAAAMVGLHSSDPATVYLSAWARVGGFRVADLEAALYDDRSLLRFLGMRRTLFVVPPSLAAVIEAACTQKYAGAQNRRLIRMIEEQGLADDGEAWLDDLKASALKVISEHGPITGRNLRDEVPELQKTLTYGEGTAYGGEVAMTTRVLFLLATEGSIARARPLGSWLSSQYRWARLEQWLGEPLEVHEVQSARAILLSAYLETYGPATFTDIAWWAGWTKTEARTALGDVEAVEVEVDEGTAFLNADDVAGTEDPGDWVALLPSLDPTIMGYKERDWFLGPHAPELFDRNGNAGPTIWVNGRVVGGWAQRKSGEIVLEFLEPVDASNETRVRAKADELERWLGEVVVTPRFRSPNDKRLSA